MQRKRAARRCASNLHLAAVERHQRRERLSIVVLTSLFAMAEDLIALRLSTIVLQRLAADMQQTSSRNAITDSLGFTAQNSAMRSSRVSPYGH